MRGMTALYCETEVANDIVEKSQAVSLVCVLKPSARANLIESVCHPQAWWPKLGDYDVLYAKQLELSDALT
jgi:hypothetical protein